MKVLVIEYFAKSLEVIQNGATR